MILLRNKFDTEIGNLILRNVTTLYYHEYHKSSMKKRNSYFRVMIAIKCEQKKKGMKIFIKLKTFFLRERVNNNTNEKLYVSRARVQKNGNTFVWPGAMAGFIHQLHVHASE